jgi:hypothetical protein
MSYQGWSNYDTWNVALWLRNDEFAYYQLHKQLVFCASQVHKDKPVGYAEMLQTLATRVFGAKTPDGVVVTKAKSEVNWDEIVASLQDDIWVYEEAWRKVVEALPRNAQGGHEGIVDAAVAFRHMYEPSQDLLIGYSGPFKGALR